MTHETLPDHIARPHLRPIQPLPVRKDNQQLVALRDPTMMSRQTLVVPPQVLQVLQLFRGDRSLDDVASQIKADRAQLVELAQGLDKVGLLWGPTFEKMEADLLQRVETAGAFPAVATAGVGEDEAACRRQIDEWFEQSEDPELDAAPVGIVAPHLDYDRGWPNYAAAYYGLRGAEAPDRVVILGTNHFGLGDGVVMTSHGFETPMGRARPDEAVVGPVLERLGRPVWVDQLDFMPEHSVELHLPWIRHCLGDVPVVAALLPDPLKPMVADDDERIAVPQFLDVLREVLDDVGGETLFVASADLSHVGPHFGEPRPADEQRRVDVERHDREMLGKFLGGDADEFLAAMTWNRNPTRWCSIGAMTGILTLVQPESVELLDYRQATDDAGRMMVSSAAVALMK